MSISEVIERATINFPKLLNSEEMEDLFRYFRQEAGLEIAYTLRTNKRMGNLSEEPTNDEPAVISSVEISGGITNPRNYAVHDSFESQSFESRRETSDDDLPYFSGIRFSIVPGWNISDYRSEILQLWDETRGLVKRYFAEKKL